MKFLIAVDLEGLACVVGSPNIVLTDSKNYGFACRQAVRETNAAARALFDGGAKEVIVWDNHGTQLNWEQYENIDERCDIILGSGNKNRWNFLDSTFSGVLLIGYHSMDNTNDAVLAHTFNSTNLQWIRMNDIEVGEIAIDAALVGKKNVPVIFVSSDDKGIAEANKFLPWAHAVVTKKGLGRNMAISKHPVRAAKEIYEGVAKSLQDIKKCQIFSFKEPIVCQIRYKRLENAQNAMKGIKRVYEVDPYTVERVFDTIDDFL
jgi:D-amino peptidase